MICWSRLITPASQRDSSLCRVACISSAFPNIVAVPLIVMKTLCDADEVNVDYKSAKECFEVGGAYIFINSAAWSIIFFTVGVAQLRAIDANNEVKSESDDDNIRPTMKPKYYNGLEVELTSSPSRPSTILHISNGGPRLVAENLSLEEFQTLKNASITVVAARHEAQATPLQLQPQQPPQNSSQDRAKYVNFERLPPPLRKFGLFMTEPLNCSLAVGCTIGLVRPLQAALFSDSSTSIFRPLGSAIELLSSPVVCLVVLSTGAALVHVQLDKINPRASTEATATSDAMSPIAVALSVRTIIGGFCASRLVVAPAITMVLFALVPDSLRPRTHLLQLVMLISAGMPSAQVMVILLNKLNLESEACQLAFLFLFQYSMALITTVFLVAFSLFLVYGV